MNVHVVFGSGGGALKHIFKVHEIKEQVFIFIEDLMWGPLGNVFDAVFQDERIKWWERIADDNNVEFFRESYQKLNTWRKKLKGDEKLVFWIAENSPDYVTLMSFLIFLPKSHPISKINVSKVYRKVNGKFKPKTVGEMTPEQLFELFDDAKPISNKERENFELDWTRLLDDKGTLRIYEGQNVKTVADNFFDEDLLQRSKKITKERIYYKDDGFFPEKRLAGEVIGHSKQVV